MSTEILMPALSPTMEEGKLSKWLVKEGDTVKSGTILAEIETDKATMEFEAVDEGVIGQILVAEGSEGVKVNSPIATLLADGEKPGDAPKKVVPVATALPKGEDHKAVADSSDTMHALLSPLSSIGGAMAQGDAFVTCLTMLGAVSTNYHMAGLCLSDGTTFNAGNQLHQMSWISSSPTAGISNTLRTRTKFNTAGSLVNGGLATSTLNPTYFRIVKLASNGWRLDVSVNGVSWINGPTITWAQTPTHIGFMSSNWSAAVAGQTAYEFLRRVSGVS